MAREDEAGFAGTAAPGPRTDYCLPFISLVLSVDFELAQTVVLAVDVEASCLVEVDGGFAVIPGGLDLEIDAEGFIDGPCRRITVVFGVFWPLESSLDWPLVWREKIHSSPTVSQESTLQARVYSFP